MDATASLPTTYSTCPTNHHIEHVRGSGEREDRTRVGPRSVTPTLTEGWGDRKLPPGKLQLMTRTAFYREKRPDDSFFPHAKIDWPLLVVETGKTQNTESLEESAEWWPLNQGTQPVNLCLLAVA